MCQAFQFRVCFLVGQYIKRWLRCWNLQKRTVMMIISALTTRYSFGNIADTHKTSFRSTENNLLFRQETIEGAKYKHGEHRKHLTIIERG